MDIKTNHHYRPILQGYELTPAEQEEAGLNNWSEDEMGEASFIRYRGQLYPLGDFVRIVPAGGRGGGFAHYDHTGNLKGWDGLLTDSFFSALVLAYHPEDFDMVKIGLALC